MRPKNARAVHVLDPGSNRHGTQWAVCWGAAQLGPRCVYMPIIPLNEKRRKHKQKTMSACLFSSRVVNSSDIFLLTTHQIMQHMSHFPSQTILSFAPYSKCFGRLAHIMDMHAHFFWLNVLYLHWSKEKFQNATCTHREALFGLR